MPDSGERVFDCRMCRWARSAVGGVGVEVVCREGPSKMPVQVKRSFDLVEGSYDGRVAGVAPLVTDVPYRVSACCTRALKSGVGWVPR